MKRRLVPVLIGISAMTLLTGCVVGFSFGSGKKESSNNSNTSNNTANTATTDQHPVQQTIAPTVGQQLLDLKKARDAGAITEQEYETEKAKILSAKQ